MTDRKKPTRRKLVCVRALVTRCHLNYKGTIPLYISALSNNKLHCKVCAPNFHCFKFIFKISPLSLLPTTCSQWPQAPWRSKIVTFLICWTYFNTLFFLCQDFFTIFLKNVWFECDNIFSKSNVKMSHLLEIGSNSIETE